MATYKINYGTGCGNKSIEANDIDTAQEIADRDITYTQCSVTILDANDNEIALRPWNPTMEDVKSEINPIIYRPWGYYGDWYQL